MAVALSRTRSEQLQLQRKNKEREETNITTTNNNVVTDQKRAVVPVVYYLARNGQLEHPHFMEVPLSSTQGLYLRDVIQRLSLLRGKSMASHYSWSSKRSYKSGYVWHDLEENDFIQPVHGGEYVLKGSEIVETLSSPSLSESKSPETSSCSSTKNTPSGESEFRTRTRRRNQSWGAIDLHEYKVYKAESAREFADKAAADASTQTDDKRRRRKVVIQEEIEEEEEEELEVRKEQSTELSREEISPPPSDSSPETLETLMKADGRLILPNNNPALSTSSSLSQAINNGDQVDIISKTAGYCPSGRMKASSVLMSLISCGSISFRDCGATAVKDHGLSLISQYKTRVPRGGNPTVVGGDHEGNGMMIEVEKNVSSSFAKMALEDKEYFSGSLIETKKDNFVALKRSSSYNADRSSHLKLQEKEVDGVRAKCIPRKPKTQASSKKGCTAEITSITINSTQHGNQN